MIFHNDTLFVVSADFFKKGPLDKKALIAKSDKGSIKFGKLGYTADEPMRMIEF
ncbi:MAG: hypothetical protein NVSMB24_27170 [Mucilaginibacter sp.]